jgi:type I restriction enzyme R subunit
LTRQELAAQAKVEITAHFNSRQQAFLDFLLSQYVKVGVEELDRYRRTVADLGRPEEIGSFFAGFQKYLYQELV